jgi:hypothetical protein
MTENPRSAFDILGPLIVDPETVQIGKMQTEEEGEIDVAVAYGRNGKKYFRVRSVKEALAYEPYRFKDSSGSYIYRMEAKHRLDQRFPELDPKKVDDYTLGADFYIEEGQLKYNHLQLAIWSAWEASRFPISIPDKI